MAQIFTDANGSLVIPQASATYRVQTAPAGLAANGVVTLVGEADMGPDWTLEADVDNNGFGPDDASNVEAKYGSGAIVDAFRACAQPLNDPRVPGAPTLIKIVKTNVSTKASAALTDWASSSWASIFDKSYGALGNLIYTSVTAATNETVPTTAPFTWINNVASLNTSVRVSGAAELTLTVGANTTPAALQSALAGLGGAVSASGGALRTVIPGVSGNLVVVASGNNITITYTGTWTTNPSNGDTLVITGASVIASASGASAGGANVGAYVVTGATTNTILATKLSDAGKSAAVAGTITAPVSVSSTAVAATTDIGDYAPITFAVAAGNPVNGLGKSLEVNELTSGTDLLSRYIYALSATPVTWVSKAAGAQLLVSATEYSANLNNSRQSSNVSETITAGGEIALQISYKGTTASVTVGATTLSAAVTGGTGAAFATITLSKFKTLTDLATFIASKTGWACSTGTPAIGALPPSALDEGTYNCGSNFSGLSGRIKVDAYRLFKAVQQNSVLVQIGNPALQPNSGLPQPVGNTFLAGGAKGGTTQLGYNASIDGIKAVTTNFVVPCFCNDATTDILNGLTESSSNYTIAGIHAYTKSHVLAMFKPDVLKNRQACLAIRDTYANAKKAAANVNSFLCTMSFLDQMVTGGDGNVDQLPPYIDAAIAAGAQAGGIYKAVVRKVKNINGSVQAAAHWNGKDDSQVKDALLAGLLPTRQNRKGAWIFVSDQTTYTQDPNFVFNSLQAVYVANQIALSVAEDMEDAFCGEANADVSDGVATAFLETLLMQLFKAKLTAASDDAEFGYRNPKVLVRGGALKVSFEVKLDGTIYFIPINFLISQVSQGA